MAQTENIEWDVHPLYRLKAEARSMKQEAEFIKRRSASLEDQQKTMAKDIADMEAAQVEVKALVVDYLKKETNLRLLHNELKDFAKIEGQSLRESLKEGATKLEKARGTIESEIRTKRADRDGLKTSNDAAADVAGEKLKLVEAAQATFDKAKADAKATATNLEGLKVLRDRVAIVDDPREKYALTLEIEKTLAELPGKHVMEKDLEAALHGLLAAKAEYHSAAAAAKNAQAELARAEDDFEKLQSGRLEKLLAAAKPPAPAAPASASTSAAPEPAKTS
jgi:hypothetical protein